MYCTVRFDIGRSCKRYTRESELLRKISTVFLECIDDDSDCAPSSLYPDYSEPIYSYLTVQQVTTACTSVSKLGVIRQQARIIRRRYVTKCSNLGALISELYLKALY